MSNFNSRPSARGDGRAGRAAGAPRYFNSRPSARGDFRLRCAIGVHHSISIHAPPRGATRKRGSTPQASRNFNSRPSARGDAVVVGLCAGRHISIHAPPRGATASAAHPHIHIRFQFTPLREGRRRAWRPRNISLVFQFTPLREGRRVCFDIACNSRRISIHAPPRGATWRFGSTRRTHTSFQFTPLREGRQSQAGHRQAPPYFNSRPSARGDGKRYAISANLLFNPYKSAWLNNRATQFVEIILVIFHRIIA